MKKCLILTMLVFLTACIKSPDPEIIIEEKEPSIIEEKIETVSELDNILQESSSIEDEIFELEELEFSMIDLFFAKTHAEEEMIENFDDLKKYISNLKTEKKDLKEQVKNEVLSKEEAKEIWQNKIKNLRSQKDMVFQKITQKFLSKNSNKPNENSQKIRENQKILKEIREMSKNYKQDLKVKIKNGEIDRETANKNFKNWKHSVESGNITLPKKKLKFKEKKNKTEEKDDFEEEIEDEEVSDKKSFFISFRECFRDEGLTNTYKKSDDYTSIYKCDFTLDLKNQPENYVIKVDDIAVESLYFADGFTRTITPDNSRIDQSTSFVSSNRDQIISLYFDAYPSTELQNATFYLNNGEYNETKITVNMGTKL